MLTRDYILEKIEEYRNSYMESLAQANANHGAMLAMQDALRMFDLPPIEEDPDA